MQVVFDIETKVEEAASGFTLSLENLFQTGFNLFRKSPAIYIIYSIIGAVALSNPISGIILGGPVITGYYVVSERVKNHRPAELSDFFRSFDKFIPLFILNLLMSLLIFLGLMILILPGIYLAVSYLFGHFLVWFYDVDPADALRLSRRCISGNFGQILLLCLLLGIINTLGVLAFGVGILLTLPFSYCVVFAAFDDIVGIP